MNKDQFAYLQETIEEQRARIAELEEWQQIVLGTGTDQEAVIRMAATEYTKVAIQTWREANEQQRAEIERLQASYDADMRSWTQRIERLQAQLATAKGEVWENIMNKPIQLMPGLSIQFGNDGTWLYFKSRDREAGVALGNLLKGEVAYTAYKEWVEERRNAQAKEAQLDTAKEQL